MQDHNANTRVSSVRRPDRKKTFSEGKTRIKASAPHSDLRYYLKQGKSGEKGRRLPSRRRRK